MAKMGLPCICSSFCEYSAAPTATLIAAWKERYAPAIARLKIMTDELKRSGNIDLAVLSVLLRELRALA